MEDVSAVETAMQAWFPATASLSDRKAFSEAEISDISNALHSTGRQSWSQVPRLYATLRIINQLPLIDVFLTEGLSDVWFPFTHKTLPESLRSQSARNDFLETQRLVLTKALDLEREDGRHRHFSKSSDIPVVKLAELGRGGNGIVEKVMSTISRKEYARKLIPRGTTFRKNKEALKTFEIELGAMKKLSHMHIVELIGSYTDPRYVGILMSPIADCNMHQYLTEPLSVDQASLLRTFFGCLAAAVNYLHQNRVRHRDIKPQNILIKNHQVLITDFGISRDWTDLGQSTTAGPASRTPQYCAPEVAANQPRNTSSDVWSLGCVYLEMWSVICGETLQTLKAYFLSNGSSICYHNSPETVQSWCEALLSKTYAMELRYPSIWISMMLKPFSEERCNAQKLFDTIRETAQDPDAQFSFMGLCCTEQEDTAESVQSSVFEPEITTEATTESSTVSQMVVEPYHLMKHSEPDHERALSPMPPTTPAADATMTTRRKLVPSSNELLDQHWENTHITKTASIRSDSPSRLHQKEVVVGNTPSVPLADSTLAYMSAEKLSVVEEFGNSSLSTIDPVSRPSQASASALQVALDDKASGLVPLQQTPDAYTSSEQTPSSAPDPLAVDTQGHVLQGEGFFSEPDELAHRHNTHMSPPGYQMRQLSDEASVSAQHQEPLRLPRRLLNDFAIPADARVVYDQDFQGLISSDGEYAMGDQIVGYMQQSGLTPEELTHVWTLSDPTDRGKLNCNEFAVAMHLIFRRLAGYALPAQLPLELVHVFHKPSLSTHDGRSSSGTYSPSIAQTETFTVPSKPSSPYTGQTRNTLSLGASNSDWDHQTLPADAKHRGATESVSVTPRGRPGAHIRSPSQPLLGLLGDSGHSPVSITTSLVELPADSIPRPDFLEPSSVRLSFLSPEQQTSYEQLFKSAVGDAPILGEVQAKTIFTRSKLSEDALDKIWNLVYIKGTTGLLRPQFCLAVYLRSIALKGASLPRKLPPSIKAIMSEAVNTVIQECVDAGQLLNGFSNLSKHYMSTDTTLRGDAKTVPDRSTVDVYHTSRKGLAEGIQPKPEQPPRYSEVVDNRTALAQIPLRPSSKSAGKLPSYAKQPTQTIVQFAVNADQDHDLCGDFHCRKCPKPVITINMIIEERLRTFSLPLVLLHPDAFLVQLRFMLNIPSDFEVVFERYPHWGDHYVALQPGDTEQFERLCMDARTEMELNMRAKPVTGSLVTGDDDWEPSSPTRAPPLPPTYTGTKSESWLSRTLGGKKSNGTEASYSLGRPTKRTDR